jgi:hypothetical protein
MILRRPPSKPCSRFSPQLLLETCDDFRVLSMRPPLQEIDQLKSLIPQSLAPEPMYSPDRVEPGGLPVNVGSEP